MPTQTLLQVSSRHIFVILTCVMGTQAQRQYYTRPPSLLNHRFYAVCKYLTLCQILRQFFQVFDNCRTHDQQLTCYVEIHTDEPQYSPLHMELTLTDGVVYNFVLVDKVIHLDNYTLFHQSSYK